MLLTLFARDCVVAVSVDMRGSSAPAEAEGWRVVRRALLRLLLRARLAESAGVVGVWPCVMPFLSPMRFVIKPGPTLFLGGLLPLPIAGSEGTVLD